MADVNEAYKEANAQISDAQAAYLKTLAAFKGSIKNDLASISASGEKVKNEAAKIRAACAESVELMNGVAMQTAIANAERLAAALGAISELQSHSITFAVLGRKSARDTP